VSHLIPDHSTKRDRAIRFGRALEAAMARREVGTRPIADALGSSRTSVMYWRTGRMLPRIETVRRLAAVLDSPELVALATELRRKRCLIDEVEFVDDSGSDNRVFCSASCQRVAEKRRLGSSLDKRAAVAERRLVVLERAVDAYCAACEPEGRCVTPDCQLRPVSPLPLFAHRLDLEPVDGGRKPLSIEDRRARGRITASAWAAYTPDERAARIAHAAEASRRARGLVPA
jgi:transcriptional regulator with XRE-family HTH domain